MKDFLYFKFKGKRYDTHLLPVEVLSDFQAYSNLISALAAHIYKKNNQNRQKVPRGFKNRFEIKLNVLGQGSTVAPLIREFNESYGEMEAMGDEFSLARDMVNEALKGIGDGSGLPGEFPEEMAPHFEKFGAGLQDGEEILLSESDDFSKEFYRYNKNIQREILKSIRRPYSSICEVSGRVDSIILSKQKFSVIAAGNNAEIWGSYPIAFKEALRDAHRQNEKVHVRLFGIGRYNPDEVLYSVDNLQHIIIEEEGKLIPTPNPEKRLVELSSLKKGWYDGQGEEFKPSELELIKKTILHLLNNYNVPAPFIYPTPENNVTLEWSLGAWELSCDFDFEKKTIEVSAINTISGEEIDKDLSTEVNFESEIAAVFSQIISQSKKEKLDE